MLQHVEFEVYVNKHHIWFQKKKHKTKCGYHHTVTNCILYRLLRNFFQKFIFYKEQLYDVLSKHNIYI